MIITLKDVKEFHYCTKGARRFLKNRLNISWSDFIENGVCSEQLRKTGDSMAIKLVERVENGR